LAVLADLAAFVFFPMIFNKSQSANLGGLGGRESSAGD
jgi:hypothetical protein